MNLRALLRRCVAVLVFSLSLELFAVDFTNCVAPPPGLVSWWRGENDLLDGWDSNNGSLVLAGTGITYADGKVGRAFSMGAPLAVGDNVSLRMSNSLTVEAWVFPTALSGATPRTIVSKFDYPFTFPLGTQSGYYLGTTNNGSLIFMVSPNGGVRTNASIVTTQKLPANQWSFVVASYDGSALRIYINAVLAASTNYSSGIFPGTATLGIGAVVGASGSAWPFAGLLDEISLYNRALSEAEIQAIFNADSLGKCLSAPIVAVQPKDQSVPLGEDALFSVTALGSKPLSYQWRFNNTNLAGATQARLILEKLQTNRAGAYSVFVSNAWGTVLSSNATLSLLARPACVPPPPGMISWWPADGSPVDAIGTNNILAGTFLPPSTLAYTNGKVGQVFNQEVSVANSSSLNFGSNADLSIEAWVKIPSALRIIYPPIPPYPWQLPIDSGIVEKLSGTAGYSLETTNGLLTFKLGTLVPLSLTNSATFISPGPDLRDGLFHHVAVTVDRDATNGGNLYVDGQVVLTFDPTHLQGSLSNTALLTIGGARDSIILRTPTSSLVDEAAIYNRALTAGEIASIRQAGAAGKCKVSPSIVTQPQNERVTVGSNATLVVVAAGPGQLRYQWFRNNFSINGATNSTYDFVVQPGSGGVYSVRVTNAFGSVTSSNALLLVNSVPNALPQAVTLNEDSSLALTLSGTDADNDALTFSIITPPSHGVLNDVAPAVTYTPARDYFGVDSFTFTVSDGLAIAAAAVVDITVLPVNDPPAAIPQVLSMNEDNILPIILTGSDPDGDLLGFNLSSFPLHGTLTGTAPNLFYRPDTNFFGADAFSFTVSDNQTQSPPATVSITVLPINDPPLVRISISPLADLPGSTNLTIIAGNNSNALVTLDGSASSDVENDTLSFSWWEDTNMIAAASIMTNAFNLGSHTLTLQAYDGHDVGSANVTFDVLSPEESVVALIAFIDQTGMGTKLGQPLIATLSNAAASFDNGRMTPAINQLRAFQNKVRAQIAPSNAVLAQQLTSAAQEVIDSTGAP
jgi:hypothetical protein